MYGTSATSPHPSRERQLQADVLVDRIAAIMRANLPRSISPAYFDRFYRRNQRAMVQVVELRLTAREIRPLPGAPTPATPLSVGPAELWGPAERTRANLRAMEILASKAPSELTDADRRALSLYSGWGGLSIEKVKDRFQAGIPVPEARGLIHEYYSPSFVAREVARVLSPLLPPLVGSDGVLQALEPSAGIGRFMRAFEATPTLPPIHWTAVEISQVSARLLEALFPNANVTNAPFERWLQAHLRGAADRFHLVVSNPPYGPRGGFITEDPDRAFRFKQAYLYFLLRGLELLVPRGIGVYLIPSGFLTGVKSAQYRQRVLLTHHLMSAYRLPSEAPETRDPIFPGANLVTDLLFFRARGGQLAEVPRDDQHIVEGRFFEEFPRLILGQVQEGDDNDDHTRRFRRRYAVIGDFRGLPPLVERPMARGVFVEAGTSKGRGKTTQPTASRSVTRDIEQVKDLPEDLDAAVHLGLRADTFLAQVARGDTEHASLAWSELQRDLLAWKANNGNPFQRKGLLELARKGTVGAERFLSAWTRDGELAEALAAAPKHEPVYRGEPNLLSQADWLYRQRGSLSINRLVKAFDALTHRGISPMEALVETTKAGWCVDAKDWGKAVGNYRLFPSTDYYSGDLWPKVDRCRAALTLADLYPAIRGQASKQLEQLMASIKPAVFEDILDGLTPRESWLPVDVVNAWVNDTLAGTGRAAYSWRRQAVTLFRDKGVLQVEDLDYEALTGGKKVIAQLPVNEQTVWFVGWANHHLALFRPPQPEEIIDGVPRKRPLDEVRLEVSAAWIKSFADWLKARPEVQARVEEGYNRTLRGYVAPTYSAEPIHIARWVKDGPVGASGRAPVLFDYQNAAARRILANRSGLLAFDVGLGKTYTGIAIVARARQEGWARRPVIVVPNSIVWKWFRDIKRCLPDYRVLVVGSNRKVLTRGDRRGRVVAEPDTPRERTEKWTAFQAGRADVVLLTYSALGRTRVDPAMLYDYVDNVTAIQRRVVLGRAKRVGKNKKDLTEREAATLQEATEAWIAERLEAPAGWDYDPGIEWHSLGIDFLMVDESQNMKNLFMPEEREGGIPDAMGGQQESNRAWQLDFRCASVRAHTGGSGVVLLSATPAKNGPVEFYNAIHLIQPKAWTNVGITDPEAFIDRYCAFEAKTAQTPDGKLTMRQACTAFKNLHELRDVVFRYADFKTAEDVGLKIPDARNQEHRVELNDDQVDAIRAAWAEIRELREEMKRLHGEAAARMREALRLKIQGVAMRVDMIAIHPELPGASQLKKRELEAIDPHSAKIDAVVEEIMATDDRACPTDDPAWCLSCGHIVFVENVAVHYWIRKALVEAGVPERRIAILNAVEAKDPETRQQTAERFNGIGSPGDEEYEPPAFDVVIANSVAYEGVDLQRRTCKIYHVDLPWDPATLQQRNGRGVRQGNTFESVTLHYYLGRPSGDGRRLSLIDKKRSWMASLVKSQDRVTNNPAAAIDVSIEDLLLDIVPPEERDRVLKEREEEAKRLAEQLAQRARVGANKLLGQANARFRRAEQTRDPAEAGRLREEGESILAELAKIDSSAWPWLEQARRVRTQPLYLPDEGPPLWPGLRLKQGSLVIEVGHAGTDDEGHAVLGVRHGNDLFWREERPESVNLWATPLKPADLSPADLPDIGPDKALALLRDRLRWDNWPELHWRLAPDEWRATWWPVVAEAVIERLKEYAWRKPLLPVQRHGRLAIASDSLFGVESARDALPPTNEGWQRYLELAPESELKFTELNEAAKFWWGRRIPRDLLSAHAQPDNHERKAS